MRRSARQLFVLALLATVAGCSGDDGTAETSVTATTPPVTSLAPAQEATTATTGAGGSSTTDVSQTGEFEVPGYSIHSRAAGESGDTVVVLIDPDFDGTMTEIDLQNLLSEVVDNFPPVFEAHVVDSVEAAELVVAPEVDATGQTVLDEHYLARLEEGFRIVFTGPFSEAGTLILGS